MHIRALAICLAGALAFGCDGTIDGPGADVEGVGKSGLRRLTQQEYDNTLFDLLGDEQRLGRGLPRDSFNPFDNDYRSQAASAVLVEALETLAEQAATELMADPTRRDAVIGCTPVGPADAGCLESFIRSFGRRALRRPLADSEVDALLELQTYSVEDDDFYTGAALVVRALLQDPEFIYRVEIGAPVKGRDGLFALDPFETATRLSYFLWGSTPDDALLDRAEAGELGAADQMRDAATAMLADPKARERVDRFHALWLGYHELPHEQALTNAMRTETGALIQRVVFEDRASWLDLFNANETYIDDTLAEHYGLPLPGGPAWVPYGDSGRGGILSHASFLSVAGKFGDTSPTQRGRYISTHLLCKPIPPPPPDVNVDEPPESPDSDCKYDRYAAHRAIGTSCAGCHIQMDPIGFGLENYDQAGQYREHDTGLPECTITGEGTVADVGVFNGPAELGDLLVDSGMLETCAVTQLYRFAMGHEEAAEDMPYIEAMADAFASGSYQFDTLLVDFVAMDAFRFRRED
jgi:hypothetical protein